MMLATTLLIGATVAEEIEACPADNLACKAAGETCGYEAGQAKVALCDEGLFCQSDTVIPPNEISAKYVGKCMSACGANHIAVDYNVCAPACFVEDDLEPRENWLWASHEDSIIVDQCNNQCKCDATTGTFDCADAAPCMPAQACKPLSKEWKDSQDNTCDWYEADAMRCLAFGSGRANADGIGADQACCVCGGGKKEAADGKFLTQQACPLGGGFVEEGMVLYTDTCGSSCECGLERTGEYDWTCTRGEDCPASCEDQTTFIGGVDSAWVDEQGNTCEWYSESPVRCLAEYRGQYDNLRAAQACCACGGMEKLEAPATESSDNMPVIAAAAGAGAFAIAFFVMLGCYCKTKSQLDEYKMMNNGPAI